MITDFGTKRKRKIRLLIQIVKNRSFISRKAEKSDLILKKWRKAKFVKCLKTAKIQSCFEILEFIAKRILYKSFTHSVLKFVHRKQTSGLQKRYLCTGQRFREDPWGRAPGALWLQNDTLWQTPSFVGALFSAGIAIFRVRICRVNI